MTSRTIPPPVPWLLSTFKKTQWSVFKAIMAAAALVTVFGSLFNAKKQPNLHESLKAIERDNCATYNSGGSFGVRQTPQGLSIEVYSYDDSEQGGTRGGIELRGYGVGVYQMSEAPNTLYVTCMIEHSLGPLQEMERGQVTIYGHADGIPVRRGARYDGGVGRGEIFWYRSEAGVLEHLRLRPGRTRLTNERIAALRARDMALHLRRYGLKNPDLATVTHDEVGSRHRGVTVEMFIPYKEADSHRSLPN